MNKYILVFALLAVALAGCAPTGNELMCSSNGELFYRGVSGNTAAVQANSLYNIKQYCVNQPDGSILVKDRRTTDETN